LVRPAPTVGAAQRRLWFLDVLKVRPRPNANSLGPIRVPTTIHLISSRGGFPFSST
jgi:hypothetical protein